MNTPISARRIPTGPAAAALIACAVGVLMLGAMTTGAEISPAFKEALNWHEPAGPLSGKTTVGVVAWLVVWALLRLRWKEKDVGLKRVFVATLALIALGLVFTFPLVYEAFQAGH